MKNILVLIYLLPALCFSQNQGSAILNDEDYKKYEKEALELYSSKEYNNYNTSMNDFSIGLGKADFDFGDVDFKKWLDKNFEKTNFKSKEEAVFLYERFSVSATEKLLNRIRDINKDAYSLRLKYGTDIFEDAFKKILEQALKPTNNF